MFRTILKLVLALTIVSQASVAIAQQKMSPAAQPAPAVSQAPSRRNPRSHRPHRFRQHSRLRHPARSGTRRQRASPAPDATATPAEREGRLLKAAAAELRELSPWVMFKNADVLVKAVMIGLAFASLVTWTIFIAKMIELSVVQRKLRSALCQDR